jgi:hypothetical protein
MVIVSTHGVALFALAAVSLLSLHVHAAPQPASDPKPEPEANAFSVNLRAPSASEEALVPVYATGSLTGSFAYCTHTASAHDDCYNASVYDELSTFVFSNLPANAFVNGDKPLVSGEGGRAAPVLGVLEYDAEKRSGSFVVRYMCGAPAETEANAVLADGRNDTSMIMLHIPLIDKALDVTWVKQCGSGKMQYADFGFIGAGGAVVPLNGDGTHGVEKEVGLEFGPNQLSTELMLTLRPPASSLAYAAPVVTSSDPDRVNFSVRGARAEGSLDTRTPEDAAASISILYECKESSSVDFAATIAIPPWRSFSASWTKDCGGRVPKSLLIGFDTEFDVFQDGELDTRYNATGVGSKAAIATASTTPGPGQVRLFDETTHATVFYLSNSDASAALDIQSVTLSVTPSNLMSAEIETPTIKPLIGDGYLAATGGSIPKKGAMRLDLRFYCRRSGNVIVLVTLATLLHDNIEFSFVKHCVQGQMHHRSGVTAGSLLGAIFVACVATACIVAIVLCRKRRRDALLSAPQPGLAVPRTNKSQAGGQKGPYSLVDDDELEY